MSIIKKISILLALIIVLNSLPISVFGTVQAAQDTKNNVHTQDKDTSKNTKTPGRTTPAAITSPAAVTSPAGITSPSAITSPAAITKAAENDDESLWYSKNLPFKKEYQKALWDFCKQKELDYYDMLALIALESGFNEKCSTKNYKGLFQLSKQNCDYYSKLLKTPNKPFDAIINMNWGTTLISNIMKDKRVTKHKDEKMQRDVALSIFNRGSGGYDKKGLSTDFLKIFYKKKEMVLKCFEGLNN